MIAMLWKFLLFKTPYWSYAKSNYWFYNLSFIPVYLLYQIFFYYFFNDDRIKKYITYASALFISFALINIFFIQGILKLNTYTVVAANLVAVILAVRHFKEVRGQAPLIDIKKEPATYIFLGIFINQSTNIPYLLSMPYLVTYNLTLATAFYYVFLAINCLMFVLFAKAYLCPTPQQN